MHLLRTLSHTVQAWAKSYLTCNACRLSCAAHGLRLVSAATAANASLRMASMNCALCSATPSTRLR